ncbi:MAG: SAM-dependent methyltransferase, partial [Acidiferrobacterales bacterium]
IGPGCSGLAFMLIDLCRRQRHRLLLIDSDEMLSHIPDEAFIIKIPAYYPRDCMWVFAEYGGKADVILSYSVFHYVFAEGNLFDFLDRSLSLLAHGGEMLIGDIPNVSKRKRFLSSPAGIKFHQDFTGMDEVPVVKFNIVEAGEIDDTVMLSLMLRSREAGFDAYCLPQAGDLPLANRREDVLITKP